MPSFNMSPGLNHVGAFEVSGKPFATASINAAAGATKVSFPYVTRWIYIVNRSATDCKVGFSENGVNGTNYFVVNKLDGVGAAKGHSPRLELKVSEIWLKDGDPVDVVAGLTNIVASRTSTLSGSSWSGSAGVG